MLKKLSLKYKIFCFLGDGSATILSEVEPSSEQFAAGDMNNDDVLNVLDVVLLVNEILAD